MMRPFALSIALALTAGVAALAQQPPGGSMATGQQPKQG